VASKHLAHRFVKIFYFILLFFCAGHILPSPESYINYDIARELALLINGNESADSMYDAYSYIDWGIMLIISILFYILTMKSIKKIRSI
jgi:hypothetical protein